MNELQQQFEQILSREGELVGELAAILAQEHELLARQNAEGLDEVVAAKESKLQELGDWAEKRSEVLAEAGYSSSKEGFQSFLQSDVSGRLHELWQPVETALRECQYQNQVNGKLLDIGKQQAQELLSLLLGREGGGNELYDQSGNTSTSFGRNNSIKV